MGTTNRSRKGGLSAALFTPVQGRVLALLFGQPQRRYQSAELIRLAHGGTGAVHRQLARLSAAGLVTVTKIGNQKHYQANRASPVFEELHALSLKTVALVEPLRAALARFASNVDAAFVYGSVAKGTDRAGSDIDLLILSDSLRHDQAFDALSAVESAIGRPVNPLLMSRRDWRTKRAQKDSFASRIAVGPRIFVIGSDRDLE